VEYGPAIDAPEFGGFQTPLGPDSYAVVEKWRTADLLRGHAASPHMAEFGKRTRDMIANRVVHVLTDG
jgi:quinol monooxygenase YgiN